MLDSKNDVEVIIITLGEPSFLLYRLLLVPGQICPRLTP